MVAAVDVVRTVVNAHVMVPTVVLIVVVVVIDVVSVVAVVVLAMVETRHGARCGDRRDEWWWTWDAVRRTRNVAGGRSSRRGEVAVAGRIGEDAVAEPGVTVATVAGLGGRRGHGGR